MPYVNIVPKGTGFSILVNENQEGVLSYQFSLIEEAEVFSRYLRARRISVEANGLAWTPPTEQQFPDTLVKARAWQAGITRQYESGTRKSR